MHVLVTGAAGFIGSSTAEALIHRGHDVIGVDSFTGNYSRDAKLDNLGALRAHSRFEFREADLLQIDLDLLLQRVDAVVHLAGSPTASFGWGDNYASLVTYGQVATQRLLEACLDHHLSRIVVGSSAAVYGNPLSLPFIEEQPLSPHSPDGVATLATERLCAAYASSFALPVAMLRYFSVYGPRQRPDQVLHRLIDAGLHRMTFSMTGEGTQRRDFVYIDDAVDATIAALTVDAVPSGPVNIGSGEPVSVRELLALVVGSLGQPIAVRFEPTIPGDVGLTSASTEVAKNCLGWAATTRIADGVAAQATWQRSRSLMVAEEK